MIVNLIGKWRKLETAASISSYSKVLSKFLVYFCRKTPELELAMRFVLSLETRPADVVAIFNCITDIILFTLKEKIIMNSGREIFVCEFVKVLSCKPDAMLP